MPQPIRVRGRFATARDTAKTLGVSPSRTMELIELAKEFTSRSSNRGESNGWIAFKRANKGPSATGTTRKKKGRHAEASKKKSYAKAQR